MRLIVVIALFLISACAAPAPEQPTHYLALPEDPWTGAPLQAVHQVTVTHSERKDLFQARIALARGRMLLVLTDGLGRRGTTIEWTRDNLSMQRADWFPEDLTAERLLTGLVFAYWPEQTVRGQLMTGMSLRQDTLGRTLSGRNGAMLLTVTWPEGDRWDGMTRLDNMKQGYRMQIQSVREGS